MKNKTTLNPFKVFIIWDESFEQGLEYANIIYSLVSRPVNDISGNGIGIPVDYITDSSTEIDTSSNKQNLIFIFGDDYLISKSDIWNIFFQSLKIDKSILIIPIVFDIDDFSSIDLLKGLQHIKLPKTNKVEQFKFAVSFEVSRALNRITGKSEDIKLFLSHHKATGEKVVEKVKSEIQKSTKLKTFYDKNDIPSGEQFDLKIIENIQESIVVVFLTDGFSSRKWCKREILLAKENRRPIILLDFYNEGEERVFPYIGNVRVIRLDSDRIRYFKLLTMILLENIRMMYYEIHTQYLIELFEIENSDYIVLNQPPELLTVLNHKDENVIYIHPEPPINKDELEILKLVNENNKYMTPIMFATFGKNQIKANKGKNIGISISYPSNISINEEMKLEDIITIFMKYFITLEYNVYYAGNPKYETNKSFSTIFYNLEEKQKQNIEKDDGKLVLLVQKDIYDSLSLNEINCFKKYSDLIPVSSKQNENILTTMRKKLISSIDAHIILGGKDKNYLGEIPGILEEFDLSIGNKNAVYLLGGFGGMSKKIVDRILNDDEKQGDHNINKYKISDLNNGLNKKDNELLMTTTNANIAMALVLKGIKNTNTN